ncbi:MAG: hypothetical protein KC561_20660, partial [Myxococcales bacterium]|nr:hypothetical protein [Myxococcales bacterium]
MRAKSTEALSGPSVRTRMTRVVVLSGTVLISSIVGCSEPEPSPTETPADGATIDEAPNDALTDLSDLDDRSPDQDDSSLDQLDVGDGGGPDIGVDVADVRIDVDAGIPEPVPIRGLEAVQNPANALSFYLSWSSSEPIGTSLNVNCGDDYNQSFHSPERVTDHQVFVMGLLDEITCRATVVSQERELSGSTQVDFTVSLADVPIPPIELLANESATRQPGWTMANYASVNGGTLWVVVWDELARLRWYHNVTTVAGSAGFDVRSVPGGVLIGGKPNVLVA